MPDDSPILADGNNMSKRDGDAGKRLTVRFHSMQVRYDKIPVGTAPAEFLSPHTETLR